ncbi:hypothetical protein W97_05582 [Coniosporium apollinis CBS 100218]|uniref:Uncharacterized protein n=1 Tax=Coniosporium apollinis (strain CBS 100218) TaxID=1168221 RepID=R7YXF1_CONA1|nr:uncharacterized protein W97_05582 [Coniosporium apollinis CBS 100218]EON66484.1 hypothetical protein W97_05582 [Coniosporium apollinis CBS 100218]
MSFGWSVSDLVAAIKIVVQIGAALKETDGAPAEYQKSGDYLELVASVLTKLRDSPSTATQADVEALLTHITTFHKKLKSRFEEALGKKSKKDWKSWISHGPKKVQYALFVVGQVQALRDSVDSQLNSIALSLGLETFSISLKIYDRAEEEHARRKKAENDKLLATVLRWLDPLPVRDTYEEILGGMVDDSCKWLFDKPEYVQWVDQCQDGGQLPILWVSGIPGAGKTRLATLAIQRLQTYGNVAYFYCDTKEESRRHVVGILRTWTWQLLGKDPGQLDNIAKIMWAGAAPNETNMTESLECLLYEGCGCTLALDGLDECELGTRKKLLRLLTVFSTHTKVIVFSRELSDIGSSLCDPSRRFKHFHVTESDNESDIKHFLEEKVHNLDLEDDNLKEEIIASLLSGAKGMFLWAALVVQELSETALFLADNDGEVLRDMLRDLPEDLEDLYNRLLTTLATAKSWQLSRRFFQWLACASRPLSLEELGVAAKIVIDEVAMKWPVNGKIIKSVLSECCGPLIKFEELVPGTTTVSLIHASVKDYLLRPCQKDVVFKQLLVDSGQTNLFLAQACLTYLCYESVGFAPFGPLSGGTYYDGEKFAQMELLFQGHLKAFPFLGYAALNWEGHCSAFLAWYLGSPEPTHCMSLEKSLKRLYESDRNIIRWVQAFHRLRGDRDYYRSSTATSDLKLIYGLAKSLKEDLEFPGLAERLSSLEGSTPWVCAYGRWNRLFYSGGANDFLSELHLAAFFDLEDFVKESLDKGADVNLPTHTGQTLLTMAARGDSVNTAAVLLQSGAQVDSGRWKGTIPLHWSLEVNDWEVTKSAEPFHVFSLLLNAGSDACHQAHNGETALHLACQLSYPDDPRILALVKELLEHGARRVIDGVPIPGAEWTKPFTPLEWVSRRGAVSLMRLLLDSGATIDSRILLSVCANSKVDLEVVQVLLKAGASAKAKALDGRTALHMSARGNVELANLLFENGAEVNAVAIDGSLPLHDAVRERNYPLIELMLKHGSEFEREDSTGRTPMEIAVDNGYSDVIELLVSAGASCESERWLIETLQGRVQVRRRDGVRWPQMPKDIFEAFWLLRYHTSLKSLPRSITVRVIDMAEYWMKSTCSRAEHLVLDEEKANKEPSYLSSAPIVGTRKAPVRQIVFSIFSHDQGFSSFTEDHGTYDNSWTWFDVDAAKHDGQSMDFEGESQTLITNVHAGGTRREHRAICGDKPGMRQTGWMSRLEPGDTVSIRARARYQGWVNFVEEATMEIFTTCLVD